MGDRSKKRRAIGKLMEFAVPEGQMDAAMDLLDIYRDDQLALDLLHEFYSCLPEAGEDWVKEVRLFCRQRGLFLLAAVTGSGGYLYLISSEGIEFHGSLNEGYLDNELIDFFGFESRDSFKKVCAAPEQHPIYKSLQTDEDICPACHAVSGEYHELGCPVEVCPWCGGQLIHCSCRYDQLELDVIVNEDELARFEALLDERGRIPYAPEQRPSFADEG